MIIIQLMNDNHSPATGPRPGSPLLQRAVLPQLEEALATHAVVVLTGARQTGKSTLATAVGDNRLHLALDERDRFMDAQADPAAFVERAPQLTIDEVQRVPDLLYAIKRVVDVQRPRQPGRFLLTGSADLSLMKSVSESLAGRASYMTIWPMTRRELLGFGTTGIWSQLCNTPVARWYDLVHEGDAPSDDWRSLALRGGYPTPAYEYSTDSARKHWFTGYIRTYLQRDIPGLSAIEHLPDFRRLMRAVALRIGGLQNQSGLARDMGLPQPTVHRYLNLLEVSYQLVRIPAYAVNRTKRLVKSPKMYWSDTGLALALAQETMPRGEHLENMVLTDLLAWRETDPAMPEILYWRTVSGQEVDFVIEAGPEKLIAVEVKATTRPSTKETGGVRAFMEEYGSHVHGALLLHGGDETFWIAKGVLATPWWRVL
jgi:predicted AAA+ superfamily ATPase